jgi:hypothetical protein
MMGMSILRQPYSADTVIVTLLRYLPVLSNYTAYFVPPADSRSSSNTLNDDSMQPENMQS